MFWNKEFSKPIILYEEVAGATILNILLCYLKYPTYIMKQNRKNIDFIVLQYSWIEPFQRLYYTLQFIL